MTLYQKLLQSRSEEDVKYAYIKALGLKDYSKNLYDIQTKEIWFEAKDGYKHSTYQMFTQLLHYVQQALNKGEEVPPLLCVIDAKKAAIMKTADASVVGGQFDNEFSADKIPFFDAVVKRQFKTTVVRDK